jgi:hypothetical protein
MSVVNKLKTKAERERYLMYKLPDYKLLEEQAVEEIQNLQNVLEEIKKWYHIQMMNHHSFDSKNADLQGLARILKI